MSEEEKKAVEKISNGEKIEFTALIRKFKREGIENFIVTRPEYIYIVLNLIEKQQKEIERLKNIIISMECSYDDYIPKSKIKEINENTGMYYEFYDEVMKLLESEK